jgi:hypothetical protein
MSGNIAHYTIQRLIHGITSDPNSVGEVGYHYQRSINRWREVLSSPSARSAEHCA